MKTQGRVYPLKGSCRMGLLSASESSLDQTQQEATVFITHLLSRMCEGGELFKFYLFFDNFMYLCNACWSFCRPPPDRSPIIPKKLSSNFRAFFFFLACFFNFVFGLLPTEL